METALFYNQLTIICMCDVITPKWIDFHCGEILQTSRKIGSMIEAEKANNKQGRCDKRDMIIQV